MGKEKDEKTKPGEDYKGFVSLHGRVEVLEDMRQVAIAHYYEEGVKLYRTNIQRAHELDIPASPTLLIDGRKHSVWIFRNKVKGVCR